MEKGGGLWAQKQCEPKPPLSGPTIVCLYNIISERSVRSSLSHRILVPPSTHSHSPGLHLNLAPEENFLHVTFKYAFSCSKLSDNYYIFFIIIYCSRRVFGFHVHGYLLIKAMQPLQVYVRHWHVIIPSVNQLHLPVTPSDIHL
jgi:hypothetical protein